MTNAAKIDDAINRAERWSPYLRGLIRRFPNIATSDCWQSALVPCLDPEQPVATALRLAKGQLALGVALGDLAGLLTLDEVTQALSDFADFALNAAITDAIVAHVPDCEPSGIIAIALGKHGSRELNYSSDIDPILLFDPDTLPTRPREEPGEAAVRIGRRIVETMQARDEHGYVFRIDLRLRPSPEITPIVLPVDAAISYYESEALPWERAAFIRARACAGDVAAGEAFLDAIRPFVWRRGLDFGAVKDIRGLSRRIRSHYAQGQVFGAGYDLKRGRGGIRECEFYAQIHQLIHGGRDANLRAPATVAALDALSVAGRIDVDDAAALRDAYRTYRSIEHRLQMIEDRQTHSLPDRPEDLAVVAGLHSLSDAEALLDLLRPHVDRVGTIYDALDGETVDHLPSDSSALDAQLARAGFPDPPHAAHRIAQWRSGTLRAVRSPAAREALEAVLPQIVEALGAAQDPQRAIVQLSALIERLPSAVNLFRLLEAQPGLLKLLIRILVHAPTLADALARRTELLDRLIDASAFDAVGTVADLAAEMRKSAPLEDQLDAIRRIVGDHRFALGVQIIEGTSDPLAVAAGYARLAEAAIVAVADAVIAEFEATHGRVPGSELVILALGRMGGGELTHASDLDLIFLFTGDFANESDGPKPLGATLYFNRLSQRVIAGLSVATAAGPLYEVDTRLRPSGAQGPLAVSLDAFAKYQAEDAWTWEHMALCRARSVYGSEAARDALQAIINATLATLRDPQVIRRDAAKMRADMAAHKPARGDLDVKLCVGGLVDLEFAIHVSQLVSGLGFDPHLGQALHMLIAEGHAPTDAHDAYRLLTRLLVTLRLVAPDLEPPDAATRSLVARACDMPDWAGLLDRLGQVRQGVTYYWQTAKGSDDG